LLVTVRTDITFDSGSSTVKSEGEDIAKEIAAMLDTDPPHEIVVNGHADDRPVNNDEYPSNWELSSMRAIQFMYLLMEDSSIGPKWFSARGYGEYQPIVKSEGEDIAKEIAAMLDTDPPHEIVVNGHADDRPVNNDEYPSNWELSSMRAIQFMYLLMEDSSIGPKWFSARGYGEYQPIVKNTSEHNRAINRRVEVLIHPNYDIEEEVEVESEEDDDKSEDE